jgi:hypothetical protein
MDNIDNTNMSNIDNTNMDNIDNTNMSNIDNTNMYRIDNNSNFINVTETTTINYVRYEILDVKVIPFKSCCITIILSSDKHQKRIINLTMSLDDYTLWDSDDQYLIDWINTKLSSPDVFM